MGKALRWSYLLLRAGRKAGIRGIAHEISSRIIRRGESAYHDYAEPIHVIRDVLFVNGVMSANTQIQLDSMTGMFD